MISWPTEWEHDVNKINRFVQIINNATTFGHVITVLKPEIEFNTDNKHKGDIDVWSFNYAKGMLLLVAHLLTKSSKQWRNCKVRLFVLTTLTESEHKNLEWTVKDMMYRFRLLPDIEI